MTNEQLNKKQRVKLNIFLHGIMKPGDCWHIGKQDGVSEYCTKCHKEISYQGGCFLPNPDYTSESSPRELLNAARDKAIAEKGAEYFDVLANLIGPVDTDPLVAFSTAPAETICRAIASLYDTSEAEQVDREMRNLPR